MASALVTAAGAAVRFGGGKLLALIDGVALLDRTIDSLLDGGISCVLVVMPPAASWDPVVRRLRDPRVRTTVNPEPSRGMFSSIQIGVGELADAPLAILPGDMPFVRPETVKMLVDTAARTGAIVNPRLAGRRGHPVVVPLDVCEAILAAPPTAVLNEVLRPYAARFVNIDVEDRGVVRDVDVIEDLTRSEA